MSGLRYLLIALLLTSGWLVYYSGNSVARAADAVMRDEVDRGNFSGAVLVSRAGRVIFEKAYGPADAARGIDNTQATRFRIGSITKPFTAVLVMQLEQQGKLRLADGICGYLGDCPAGWEAITLRHLLSHSSGLFDFTSSPQAGELRAAPQTREQMLARFASQPLAFIPGEKFDYSNSNYFLLGLVIEKVAGEPYAEVLRHRILEPAAMRDTGVASIEEGESRFAHGYSRDREGHPEHQQPIHYSWTTASGSLFSTVEDLARFSEALSAGKLLPLEVVERMWVAVSGEYGLGWRTPASSAATFDRRLVEHGGRVPGFHAMLRLYLDEGVTIVVLSNRVDADPPRVANRLSAAVFDQPFVSVFDRASIQLTVEERRKYLGDYEFEGRTYTIFERDGKLYARTGELPETEIQAESPSVLYLPGGESTIVAIENSEGKVLGLSFTFNGATRTATKTH